MKKLVMPSLDKANEVLEKILKIADDNNLPYVFEASNELTIDFNVMIGVVRMVEVENEKPAKEDKPKRGRGRPPKKVEPLPNDNKDLIMVRRIVRSKNTKDPAEIANLIITNLNIKSQTTFESFGDVLGFIDKYGEQVFK